MSPQGSDLSEDLHLCEVTTPPPRVSHLARSASILKTPATRTSSAYFSMGAYVRDQDLYFSDGSVTLLVEDTLFKVHKSILQRKSAVFAGLFNPTQETDDVTESSKRESQLSTSTDDENPLLIKTDASAESFHNLLMAVYNPFESCLNVDSDSADLAKALDVLCLAHELAFLGVEAYALSAIVKLIRTYSSIVTQKLGPSRLLDVAEYVSSFELRHIAVEVIIKDVRRGILDPIEVLELAEASAGRGDLLGFAYYEIMLSGSRKWSRDDRLHPDQITSLYRGAFKLEEAWRDITSDFLDLDDGCPMINRDGCSSIRIWRDAVEKACTPKRGGNIAGDVLGKLRWVRLFIRNFVDLKEPNDHNSEDGCCDRVAFVMVVLNTLEEKIAAIESRLWTFFTED